MSDEIKARGGFVSNPKEFIIHSPLHERFIPSDGKVGIPVPLYDDKTFRIGSITITTNDNNLERQSAESIIDAIEASIRGKVSSDKQRKGWVCPKCDSSVSPDEKTCPNCTTKKPKTESDSGKTHIQE